MANPTLLSRLLCQDADKNTIPDTDAGTAGVFSQQYGWQAINSLPLSAGGKAVQRQDFNGVFNLLGGIAFYAQKGYTWEWDSSQDYVVGCIVIDPNDSKRYECISDVTANATSPSADSTHWKEFGTDTSAFLTREITPAFNTRDIITTSGTYTAPVTGWYKITAKGGGGGGGGGIRTSYPENSGGGGGGEGGTIIRYVQMTAGDTATVVIGAGGTGGGQGASGTVGGNTNVSIDGNMYTAGGGGAGSFSAGGTGGTGDIIGAAGGGGDVNTGSGATAGGTGGGTGGGYSQRDTNGTNGTAGGGGAGGAGSASGYNGGAGGDGYVWFEYFATI